MSSRRKQTGRRKRAKKRRSGKETVRKERRSKKDKSVRRKSGKRTIYGVTTTTLVEPTELRRRKLTVTEPTEPIPNVFAPPEPVTLRPRELTVIEPELSVIEPMPIAMDDEEILAYYRRQEEERVIEIEEEEGDYYADDSVIDIDYEEDRYIFERELGIEDPSFFYGLMVYNRTEITNNSTSMEMDGDLFLGAFMSPAFIYLNIALPNYTLNGDELETFKIGPQNIHFNNDDNFASFSFKTLTWLAKDSFLNPFSLENPISYDDKLKNIIKDGATWYRVPVTNQVDIFSVEGRPMLMRWKLDLTSLLPTGFFVIEENQLPYSPLILSYLIFQLFDFKSSSELDAEQYIPHSYITDNGQLEVNPKAIPTHLFPAHLIICNSLFPHQNISIQLTVEIRNREATNFRHVNSFKRVVLWYGNGDNESRRWNRRKAFSMTYLLALLFSQLTSQFSRAQEDYESNDDIEPGANISPYASFSFSMRGLNEREEATIEALFTRGVLERGTKLLELGNFIVINVTEPGITFPEQNVSLLKRIVDSRSILSRLRGGNNDVELNIGCISSQSLPHALIRVKTYFKAPLSKNNNCFFVCLLMAIREKSGRRTLRSIAQYLGFCSFSEYKIRKQYSRHGEIYNGLDTFDNSFAKFMRDKTLINHKENLCRKDIQHISTLFGLIIDIYRLEYIPIRENRDNEPDKTSYIKLVESIKPQSNKNPRYDRYKYKNFQGCRSLLEAKMDQSKEENHLKIIVHRNHCFLINNLKALTYRACAICYKWMQSTTTSWLPHLKSCKRCKQCNKTYNGMKTHRCKGSVRNVDNKTGLVSIKRFASHEEYTATNSTHYADFETVALEENRKVNFVYSASIIGPSDSKEYKEACNFYYKEGDEEDKHAVIRRFLGHCDNINGTIVFYNGSGFDFLFIYNYVLEEHPKHLNVILSNVILKDNKILSMSYKGKLLFFDLYLFTRCSLKAACKSFNVSSSLSKTDFDHTKMKSYSDLLKHKEECVKYNDQDVIALRECYSNFAKSMWDLFKVNINAFITISHMAYSIWTSMLPEIKKGEEGKKNDYFLPTLEDDKFIRRALYGGRSGPQKTFFQSKQYATIEENLRENGDVPESIFDLIRDYLIYVDIVSLYPSQMLHEEFPSGRYKVLNFPKIRCEKLPHLNKEQREWIDRINHCAKQYKMLPIIAEVDVECPKNLLTPFLLQRNMKTGALIQDLKDKKRQVYAAPDLLEAIRLGYKIKRVYKIIQFEALSRPFSSYIEKVFEVKKNSKRGSVSYQIAKLLMNALSGKLSQRIFTSEWVVEVDKNKLQRLINNRLVENFKFLNVLSKNKQAIALKLATNNPKPSKPVYLGVFILAHSRVRMSYYLRTFHSYKESPRSYFYTDTDSFVFHTNVCRNHWRNKALFSKDIGNLDDELDGGKIIRYIGLAPKTYMLEYITNTIPHRIMWKVRCKGIPHLNGDVDVANFAIEDHNRQLKVLEAETNKEKKRELEKDNFKRYLYELVDENGKVIVEKTTTITFSMMLKVLLEKSNIKVYYGSMSRNMFSSPNLLKYGRMASIIISHDVIRTIYRTRWWDNNVNRIKCENGIDSVPIGYCRTL